MGLVLFMQDKTQMVKNLLAMQETKIQSLGQEDPLEKEIATHPSILAWRIPWTEEPGGLHSMGSQRVGHDWSDSRMSRLEKTKHHTIYRQAIWSTEWAKPYSPVQIRWNINLWKLNSWKYCLMNVFNYSVFNSGKCAY